MREGAKSAAPGGTLGPSKSLLGFLLLLSIPLGASESEGLLSLVGMTPAMAFKRLGAPDRILSLRGEVPEEDDVVFFYQDFCYLFWADQRVWQVRFDENSRFTWGELGPGSERGNIHHILGNPSVQARDWDIFLIPEQPWPLRLRIFYRRGVAIDFYLYRGDF